MTISITAQRCDYDTYNVTISSPVEAGGGDHYCVVDCSNRAWMEIKLDDVPIGTSFGMYFTDANETYVLKVKNTSVEVGNNPLMLKWPYTVTALYAPAWATLKGTIQCTLTYDECCVASPDRWFDNASEGPDGVPVSGTAVIAGSAISIFSGKPADAHKCFTVPCSGACGTAPTWDPTEDIVFGTINKDWSDTLTPEASDVKTAFLASTCDETITITTSRSYNGMSFDRDTTIHVTKAAASWVTVIDCTMHEASVSGNLSYPPGSVGPTYDDAHVVTLNGMGGCGALIFKPGGSAAITEECNTTYAWLYGDGATSIAIGIRI